jgi:hypothetical protein
MDQYVSKVVSPFIIRVTEGVNLKGAGGEGGLRGCALVKTIYRISTIWNLAEEYAFGFDENYWCFGIIECA